ncbi:MAG: nicotinamide-nucleotide adenylyltransferase [Candidatus Anstonellaceae archaeon]
MGLPTALFIGRFQPFHNGHFNALKWIAERSSKVIVAIGSAQEAFKPKNPFSANERKKMIQEALSKSKLKKKVIIRFLTDIGDDEKWVEHVDKNLPKYDIVYSNNPLVRKLMKRAGKKVEAVPFFEKEKFNATKIRKMIMNGEPIEHTVPRGVYQILIELRARERLNQIAKPKSFRQKRQKELQKKLLA